MMQVLVAWAIPSGRPALSVLHFNRTSGSANILGPLNTFLTAVVGRTVDGVTAQIQGPIKILNPATGQMTGVATIGTQPVHAGAIPEEPVADATQALIRWYTPGIVNGRIVRGHTYIPGLPVSDLTGGNLASGTASVLQTAAGALAASNATLAVWSRPLNDPAGNPVRAGSVHNVDSAGVWSEFATQRPRRNR